MATYTAKLGDDEVAIHAPGRSEFDSQAFLAAFPDGGLYGLDVESTYMDDLGQWGPDFEVRLVQFATEQYAWVLDLADPEQYDAARALLANPTVRFASHTNMDVLTVFVRLGVDITSRNVDTRLLSRMVDPDQRDAHDLKTLVGRRIGPQLGEAETALNDRFAQLWRAAGGKGNASQAHIERYGWSAIEADDPVYVTYAGLDAVACRRLVAPLAADTHAPEELLDIELWLAGQANRIQVRGMAVDSQALDQLAAEAERERDIVRAAVGELTRAHPLTGCATWDSWTDKKRAAGLPHQSPLLRPHPRNRKGDDGKPVRIEGKIDTEPCCDGWLAEHGADWSRWAELGGEFTDGGAPSLAKSNIELLRAFDLDEAGAAVVERLIRYRDYHDIANKTKGLRAKVDAGGRVHPVLHTIGTVTGRMSSTGPNFQNFSKKNPAMRGLFIPEPGHLFLTADFDQIELRVVAALAREQKMIDTILEGGDLHQLTADEVGIGRDTAKMTNFLIVYGGGGAALASQAGLPIDEAKDIVRRFRDRYPAINELSRAMARYDDHITNIALRRIPVTTNKKTGDLRAYANINYLVQSSARELLVHAWRRFAVDYGRGDLIWFPVHDELILQVPEDQIDEVTAEVEKCMRFDFMGVPISASAVPLIDEHGVSRWMTSKRAEQVAKLRETQERAA